MKNTTQTATTIMLDLEAKRLPREPQQCQLCKEPYGVDFDHTDCEKVILYRAGMMTKGQA